MSNLCWQLFPYSFPVMGLLAVGTYWPGTKSELSALVLNSLFLTSPSSLGPFLRSEMWVTPWSSGEFSRFSDEGSPKDFSPLSWASPHSEDRGAFSWNPCSCPWSSTSRISCFGINSLFSILVSEPEILKYELLTFHPLAGVIKKLLAEKQRPQSPFHVLYETTPEVKLF